MNSILVTGGSGFIGSAFCKKAVDRGNKVTVLTRNPASAAKSLPEEASLIKQLDELDEGQAIDTVLNLAGEPLAEGRWNDQRKQAFYDSRVGTTQQLFNFFEGRELKPELIISGSAVGYYGPGSRPMSEVSSPVDCYSHRLCNAWEATAKQFDVLGTRVCKLRVGIVLGDKGALSRMLPAFKLGMGGPIGSGKQWMSWIHIDDMVELIFHCMKRTDIRFAINATAPNPVTNREFSKMLGSVLHRPAMFTMPAGMVKLLFGEMGQELLLEGQRVVPTKALETSFEFQYPVLRDALENLVGHTAS